MGSHHRRIAIALGLGVFFIVLFSAPSAALSEQPSENAEALAVGDSVRYNHGEVGRDNLTVLKNSTNYNYSHKEIRIAFALDDDSKTVPYNRTVIEALAEDPYGDRPEDTYEKWNALEHLNFDYWAPNGGDNYNPYTNPDGAGDSNEEAARKSSNFPDEADLKQGSWIKDAHITKFKHSPSTIAHESDGNTHYSAPSGEVRAIVDYRVPELPSETSWGSDDRRTKRNLKNHEVVATCLVHNIEPSVLKQRYEDNPCQQPGFRLAKVDEDDGSLTAPVLEYDNSISRGDTETYTLVSVIEAEAKVKKQKQIEKERCIDGTCVNITIPRTINTRKETKRVVVTDSWETKVYDKNNITVSVTENAGNRWTEGNQGLYVSTRGQPWAGLKVGDTRITSQWRFYTRRNTEWDTSTRRFNNGTTHDKKLEAVPIQTYAFPSRSGPVTSSPGQSYVYIDNIFRGQERPSPGRRLDDNVNIPIAGGVGENATYRPVESFELRIVKDSYNINAIGFYGGVRGENHIQGFDGFIIETPRKEANLTAEVLEQNESHARVHIKLKSEDGKPIDLSSSNHDGRILLPDKRSVKTNSTGEAVVVLERSEGSILVYRPGVWYGKGVAYKPARAYYDRDSRYGLVTLSNWIIQLGLVFGVIFFPFYLMDQFPNINSWPPWDL